MKSIIYNIYWQLNYFVILLFHRIITDTKHARELKYNAESGIVPCSAIFYIDLNFFKKAEEFLELNGQYMV